MTPTQIDKERLFEAGVRLISLWCAANNVQVPDVVRRDGRPEFGVCAYYRDNQIDIWVHACASFGTAGRQWSWPGYVVDRTPYGVLAHELGHHVEKAHGPRGGYRSHVWRPLDSKPLTGYCPNDNEWFAELFRLFVTNPDLFDRVRPKIADLFHCDWSCVETRPWREVLRHSDRHLAAAENKIKAATP